MTPAAEPVKVNRGAGAAAPGSAPLAVVAVSSLVALLASMILSIESFDLAREHAALPDEVRPGSFPTPKSFLGLVWLPFVTALSVAGLAGARLPRLFFAVAAAVQLVGVALAYVFMAQIVAAGERPSVWDWALTITATVALMGLTWIVIHPSGRTGLRRLRSVVAR